jgi:uncharacterized protein YecE (DUF72 family)
MGYGLMNWYLGTMGYSYRDWSGPFYPESIQPPNYLKHYSRFFNAVEIDSTFYGTPRLTTVQHWLVSTPKDFKFCLKTPRLITHEKGLRAAHLDMAKFLEIVREFGGKLGVILIQLPPSFHADQSGTLKTFLSALPADLSFAVEFRHASWYQFETEQILSRYGICWAATEYPGLPRGVSLTADFVYFRLIGRHGEFDRHDREQMDRSENLAWWFKNVKSYSQEIAQVYGYFNNDYAGFGAMSCNRFKLLAGLPAADIRPPQQGRLF